MALYYHSIQRQVSCNVCYSYFEAPNGPQEFIYKGQIFRTDDLAQDLECPHCERHPEQIPEFIVQDEIPEAPKLKDWGAF